jgi:hypothetical protein
MSGLTSKGHAETLLEQQGVFGLKTSSRHAFRGPGGADYVWKKQSSSTPLDWEVSLAPPRLAEQRRADTGSLGDEHSW